jgi:hypothetical protein
VTVRTRGLFRVLEALLPKMIAAKWRDYSDRALALTNNPAEQQRLRQRVDWGRPDEVREYVLASSPSSRTERGQAPRLDDRRAETAALTTDGGGSG